MPSGKKSRQQRRQAAPPPVRAKGSAGGLGGARQASGRTLAIAGGALAAIILVVVLVIVLTNKSSSSSDGNTDGENIIFVSGTPATGDSASSPWVGVNETPAEIETLLKGIPQDGLTLGDPNAPVTLVEWIDLQCPVCDAFEVEEFANLVNKFVRPGKLKIVMKPWNIIDANDGTIDSYRGQKGVIAAAAQNKAFNFTAVLYQNQRAEGTNWLTDGVICGFAASVDGLDVHKWVDDANSTATTNQIQAIDNYAAARPSVFNATPTFLLGKSEATAKFYGSGWGQAPVDAASLEAAITALLHKK